MNWTGFLIAVIVILVAWFIFYVFITTRDKRRLKKLLKNYDVKEDKSKEGEEHRRGLLREGGRADPGKPSTKKFDRSEGRRILQAAVTRSAKQNSSSKRKTSRRPRGILGKLRK